MVTALDLEAIVSDEIRQAADAYELEWFEVEASSTRTPLARVRVRLPDGEQRRGQLHRRRPGGRLLQRD